MNGEWKTLAGLYRAYRKAKSDSFFEGMHCDALAYARYEKNLDRNLRLLLRRLRSRTWASDVAALGGYSFAPKSIKAGDAWHAGTLHFSSLDHCAEWKAGFDATGERANASFRQIITASIDFQIISAYWILNVGHRFDGVLDPELSYGNRLRRYRPRLSERSGRLNRECVGLFSPYFGAYRHWRGRGLAVMREALSRGDEILAVTMDVRRFYHNVSPNFVLRSDFHTAVGIGLTDEERDITEDLVSAINNWYAETPDTQRRPEGALPVGLSSSKVLSNVVLAEFDSLVSERLKPLYYGRYVDDIFLVLRMRQGCDSSLSFMRWLSEQIPERLRVEEAGAGSRLAFTAPYCEDSEIVFAADKQKVFHLKGQYGLDLVDQIEEQIRRQSSEHRMMPILPVSEGEMLSRALLATPDATLEADALRKADVVSVRRLGFSLLLGNVEAHARDLRPSEWARARVTFYGLVRRHVVTPKGVFDYFTYLNRVFGLIVATGDYSHGFDFINRIAEVFNLVAATSNAGTSEVNEKKLCLRLYAKGLLQAAIQSSTVKGFRFNTEYMRLLRHIKTLSSDIPVPQSLARAKELAGELLRADLGRRPYKDYWYIENKKDKSPPVPRAVSVRKVLRLGAVRKFREEFVQKGLNEPYWPAIVFPTRPMTLAEMTLVAPLLLRHPRDFEQTIFALRGARIAGVDFPETFSPPERPHVLHSYVPGSAKRSYSVAVVSFQTTNEQWAQALKGKQDRSLTRYMRVNRIVNDMLGMRDRIDYLVFPEASLPWRWALSMSARLGRQGMSMLAGLENSSGIGAFRNDALVSLATKWPGYSTNVLFRQPKMIAAHHESAELRKAKRKMYRHASLEECRPIYKHGGHYFGVLLCSDLTNIDNRRHFQGSIDTLFALEWNKDIKSFSSLVESAALDLHAYIVQVNNRAYGDSRVRAPRSNDFERDVVRVKGGLHDYVVVAVIDVGGLREFQVKPRPPKKLGFKPTPIGFQMSELRRNDAKRALDEALRIGPKKRVRLAKK